MPSPGWSHRQRLFCFAGLAAAAALLATCRSAERHNGSQPQLSMGDRIIVGSAAPYAVDTFPTDAVKGNIEDRREFAWNMLRKVTRPIRLGGGVAGTVPAFATYFEIDEVLAMFDYLRDRQSPDTVAREEGFARDEIDRVFTAAGRDAVLAFAKGDGASQLVEERRRTLEEVFGPGHDNDIRLDSTGVLVNEAFARHVLANARELSRCFYWSRPKSTTRLGGNGGPEEKIPLSQDLAASPNFSPCLRAEFPTDAVMIKLQWENSWNGVADVSDFPTDPKKFSAAMARGRYAPVSSTPRNDRPAFHAKDQSITNRAIAIMPWAWLYRKIAGEPDAFLVAIHISSKETREWVWATFWYSPTDPDSDFGSDRPTDLDRRFSSFKMCAVTHWDEESNFSTPLRRGDESLRLNLATAQEKFPGRQWCMNPYLERRRIDDSCIHCHSRSPIGAARTAFNFPFDFSFTTASLARQFELSWQGDRKGFKK